MAEADVTGPKANRNTPVSRFAPDTKPEKKCVRREEQGT